MKILLVFICFIFISTINSISNLDDVFEKLEADEFEAARQIAQDLTKNGSVEAASVLAVLGNLENVRTSKAIGRRKDKDFPVLDVEDQVAKSLSEIAVLKVEYGYGASAIFWQQLRNQLACVPNKIEKASIIQSLGLNPKKKDAAKSLERYTYLGFDEKIALLGVDDLTKTVIKRYKLQNNFAGLGGYLVTAINRYKETSEIQLALWHIATNYAALDWTQYLTWPQNFLNDGGRYFSFTTYVMHQQDLTIDAYDRLGRIQWRDQTQRDEKKRFTTKLLHKIGASGFANIQFRVAQRFLEGQECETNTVAALSLFRSAAEQGHVEAQCKLVSILEAGAGGKHRESESFELLQNLAHQGCAEAQLDLSVKLHEGSGCERDEKAAFEWCLKSAEQGCAEAQLNLSVMLHNGSGCERDEKAAFEWCLKSAEQGFPPAQHDVAVMLDEGRGCERDEQAAFGWCLKSAEQGHKEALAQLGILLNLLEDKLSEADINHAFELCKKAATEQDYPEAQLNLSIMLEAGKVCKRDEKAAFKWCLKSAEQNFAEAQYNLGIMFMEGKGCKANEEAAFEWHQKAAKQGLAEAQFDLGTMLFEGKGCECNYRDAYRWFDAAAKQGHEKACYNLGFMLDRAIGCEQDQDAAFHWIKKAAENENFPEAYNYLAEMLRQGEGCEKNIEAALQWYRKAANMDFQLAQHNLGVNLFIQKNREALIWLEKAAEKGFTKSECSLGFIYYYGLGVEKDLEKARDYLGKACAKEDCPVEAIIIHNQLTAANIITLDNFDAPLDDESEDYPHDDALESEDALEERQQLGLTTSVAMEEDGVAAGAAADETCELAFYMSKDTLEKVESNWQEQAFKTKQLRDLVPDKRAHQFLKDFFEGGKSAQSLSMPNLVAAMKALGCTITSTKSGGMIKYKNEDFQTLAVFSFHTPHKGSHIRLDRGDVRRQFMTFLSSIGITSDLFKGRI